MKKKVIRYSQNFDSSFILHPYSLFLVPAFLLALGLFIRVGIAEVILHKELHELPDSRIYKSYARAIFHGRPYCVGGDKAKRTPGYPAFIALCWRVTGEPSDRAVLHAQALVAMIGAWAVFRLGRRMESTGWPLGTALAALLLIVLDPYAVVLSSMVLAETLFSTLLILCVLCALVAKDRESWESWWWSLLMGITVAVAILVRPSGLLLAPVAGSFWLGLGNHQKKIARILLVGSLGFLLVISPWWVRNARIYGQFVPTTLNVGESLNDGLSPCATGASDMTFEQDPRIRSLPELERDRIWGSRAIRWAWDNPRRVLELAWTKFCRFWSPWPNDQQFRSIPVIILTTLGTLPVWILAIWAVWAFLAKRATIWFCFLPAVYFCGVHLVFVSSVRYRVPAMPTIELLAGAGFVLAANWLKRWKEENDQ